MPIDPQTWQKLLNAIYEMNSADGHSSFSEAVVAGLNRIVVPDVVVFQVLDREAERIMTHMSPLAPFTEEEVAYYTFGRTSAGRILYPDARPDGSPHIRRDR